MSKRLNFRDYLPDDIVDVMDDELLDWFDESPLATDERTAAVVERVDDIYCSPDPSVDAEALTALQSAFFHRAVDICDDIDDFDDIPGAIDAFALDALRGFSSKAALDEHCDYFEAVVPAAMLNMATRWVDGKKAYKWTFEAVDKVCRAPYEPSHVPSRQRRALEDLQWCYVGGEG